MPKPVNSRAELLGFPKSYAFLVGINNYPKINANLKSAVNDARALAEKTTTNSEESMVP